MKVEKRPRQRVWPFAFARPPRLSSQTRATPGRKEGHMLASSTWWLWRVTSQLRVRVGRHARGLCLTLTWMSPLMVDISEESTSLCSIETETQFTLTHWEISALYQSQWWHVINNLSDFFGQKQFCALRSLHLWTVADFIAQTWKRVIRKTKYLDLSQGLDFWRLHSFYSDLQFPVLLAAGPDGSRGLGLVE